MKFAIISDIHEDIVNLEKVFRLAEKAACDKIVCLGDIVGFAEEFYLFQNTKNANKCVDLIKKNCEIVVVGNHDLHAIKRMPTYFKQLNFPDNWFDLKPEERAKLSNYRAWFYTSETECSLSQENIDFLRALPEFHIEKTTDFNIIFSHFIYPDISGSTNFFPAKRKDFVKHFNFIKSLEASISIVGHLHVQGYARERENRRPFFGKFGSEILRKTNQILFTSPIASSKRKSGFLIFDTSEMKIDAIELK